MLRGEWKRHIIVQVTHSMNMPSDKQPNEIEKRREKRKLEIIEFNEQNTYERDVCRSV